MKQSIIKTVKKAVAICLWTVALLMILSEGSPESTFTEELIVKVCGFSLAFILLIPLLYKGFKAKIS